MNGLPNNIKKTITNVKKDRTQSKRSIANNISNNTPFTVSRKNSFQFILSQNWTSCRLTTIFSTTYTPTTMTASHLDRDFAYSYR